MLISRMIQIHHLQFKQLFFTAISTAGLKDPPRFTCFVRNIEQSIINTLDAELSVHIKGNFLQSQEDANLHLREFLAVPNNRHEIVISRFTTIPTYEAFDNVLNTNYFVVIVESRLLFGISPEKYADEAAYQIGEKNRAQVVPFCEKVSVSIPT
ncbi:hypothetical protein PHET_07045 [Paragonimus heterotremus]|uniref:Uncharacterized protein n=1 Tax=Paragonimus heterotremus TaxID=100268 RepID=A0A8J4WH78_9TREM|nr:hypothetical protein PHET_07045 [Paragonimus heterotremus]